jgi:hypothetical protein
MRNSEVIQVQEEYRQGLFLSKREKAFCPWGNMFRDGASGLSRNIQNRTSPVKEGKGPSSKWDISEQDFLSIGKNFLERGFRSKKECLEQGLFLSKKGKGFLKVGYLGTRLPVHGQICLGTGFQGFRFKKNV